MFAHSWLILQRTITRPDFTSYLFLFSCHSSDVVWELKPKKKSRWKTMSTKEAEMLENRFKEYTEAGPVDNAIVDLENNMQVWD